MLTRPQSALRALIASLSLTLGLPATAEPIAFTDVNVIPMTNDAVLEGQTVIVRDNAIEAIGPSDTVRPPTGATIVDAAGNYLIPGLFDMHVHLQGGRRYTPVMLEMFALNGVTTVLCMRGSSGTLDFREKVANGELLGPRIFTTSPILGNVSPDPENYEEGVEVVEEFAEDGYDFIKVYNQIPAEGYRGVMDAADRLGIPVIGHAVRSVGIEGAIERGQHIAHMEEFLYGYFNPDRDETKIAPLAKRLKEANIAVVGTLIAYHNIIRQVRDIDAMLHSDGIDLMPEPLTRPWQPEYNGYLKGFTLDEVNKGLQTGLEFQRKLVKAFHDAGVPILAGTDAGIPIVVPGFSLHLDLIELVDAGLTPYEALDAATRAPAEFLGIAHTTGTIEQGKRADLILLKANPLEDIANTQQRAGVAVNGTWFDASAIEAKFAALRAAAKR